MPSSPPSLSRFRSVYSRQTALWILRACEKGRARNAFFRSTQDTEQASETDYAEPEVAKFLGLPSFEEAGDFVAVWGMMDRLRNALENDPRPIGLPKGVACNVRAIGDCFGLDGDERAIFGYFVCRRVESLLRDALRAISPHKNAETPQSLSRMLRLPRRVVSKAIDPRRPLLRFRLVVSTGRGGSSRYGIENEELAQHLFYERYDLRKVLKSFCVRPAGPSELELSHFPHLREPLDCLIPYLRKVIAEKRCGVNLLLHGVPGTGKTELSRVVGKALRLPVYEVESKATFTPHAVRDHDGCRLASLESADATLAGAPALFVFDEAEDVLSSSPFERSTADANKAWFNEILERNRTPVIWISNRIEGLDPAFVRRFDMVLEVPVPPRRERRRLVAATVGDLIGNDLGDRIAASRVVVPAVLRRAARVVGTALCEAPVAKREAALTRLLSDTLKAQGHPDPFKGQAGIGVCGKFDPAFLNTPCDLAAVARQLRSVGEARLCLHGPPGTGKTAFGHWLAEELDRPLLAKRVSFVGSASGRAIGVPARRKPANSISTPSP